MVLEVQCYELQKQRPSQCNCLNLIWKV